MANTDKSTDETLTGKTLWHNSLQSFWAVRGQAGYITFLTILLPQVLYTFVLDHESMTVVDNLRSQAEQWANVQAATSADLRVLLRLVTPFFAEALVWFLGAGLLELIGVFTLIVCLTDYYQAKPSEGIWRLLWQGTGYAIPVGLISLLIFGFLFIGSQIVFPPLMLLVIPALMAPVLIVIEKAGPLKAIGRALKFAYARQYSGGLFPVIMQVFSIAGSLYLATLGVILLGDFISNADILADWRNQLWLPLSTILPYSSVFAAIQLLQLVVSSLLVWYFAAASVSLYMLLDAEHRRLPRDGILI